MEECVAAEEIREDNVETAIPLLQQRLESACEAELLIQSAVSSLVKEKKLDITAQQYNKISSVFRKDMMKLDPKYIREHQGAIAADISAALESGMSGQKIEGHDFSEASAGIAEKYNLAKEEGVLRDLKQFRGYFDGTIEKMKEKAERKGIDIDFTQYEELQKQWHELCDNAVARFDGTSGAKMTDKDISNIIMSISHMSKGVNREFVDYFLKQWQKLIPEKGKKLVDVSNTVAFSQDLALQRQSAEELGEKTRVARIRHVIDSMVDDYPELRQIESKLSKGHDSRKGTYDIGLTIDQYMELYESCQKIKAGNVDVAEEIAVMRKAVNKVLPLSRRIKSAFSRKSKAEYDPDSDIRPQNLSDADMETLAEVFDEVTALEKSTQQQLMSEVRRAGGVPSQAVEDSLVKREVAVIVADNPDLNPIVLELEERQRERETGVARIEEVEVIELASQESQLVVVLEEHLETILEPVQILEPSLSSHR